MNMNTYLQQLRKRGRGEQRPSGALFEVRTILRNRWLIASVAVLVALLATTYALTVKPVYEANLLLQIKRNAPPSGDFQLDIPAATEIEILRSRSILSRVVDALQLDTSVEPRLFPVLGAYVASNNPALSDPGLFGYGGYVWGSERVRVAAFNVPDALLGQPFVLTVTGRDGYTLSHEELGIRVQGRVARMVRSDTRFGPLEIHVVDMLARPGARFSVRKSPQFQVVEQLQKGLVISERGRQSNVIGVSLRGSRPELVSGILNEVGRQYLRQQHAQKTLETRNQLQFYDQQVAESRRRMHELDTRLNQLLRLHGASDLGEEARILAQQSVALQAERAAKEQRRIELSSHLGDRHPEVIVVSRHIQGIRRDLNDIEARRKVLVSAQQEILAVNRDKQINSDMNIELLNTRQKLDALMLSNHVNIRVVDRAETPVQSVTLPLPVMIPLSCVLGLVAGLGASVLKNAIATRQQRLRALGSVRRLSIGAGPDQEPGRAQKKAVER